VSDCLILVILKFTNSNSWICVVDVESDGNLYFDSVCNIVVRSLDDGRGFSAYGMIHSYTFIIGNYPLVRDASSYWFGSYY
jgi:hypothetical protein